MVEFKMVLADPKTGKSYNIELKEENANSLIGHKIGEVINGVSIGIDTSYELIITGGSDKSGFSMRKDIIGPGKRKILAATGLGFNPKIKGQRRRKFIRGNEISQDTVQINAKLITYGETDISDYFKENKS